MFVGVNDNLTLKEFNDRVEPGVSVAHVDGQAITFYQLEGEADRANAPFQLLRMGMTQIDRRMPPQRGVFPTAAAPHPFCPAHTYTPVQTAARQAPSKVKKPLPSYLRVVA